MVPSGRNAGRSLASTSTVVSGRMPSSPSTVVSPLRPRMVTGTISCANSPAAAAAAARWWDRAAKLSCSNLVIGSRSLVCSVSEPIAWSVNTSRRPSNSVWSSSVTSPNLKPALDPRSRCGAFVMDSMPPATTTSYSPALISWSASAMASRPDRQTLLMVMAGTSMPIPPTTAACRAGSCPHPACSTWPMITYWTSVAGTPLRCSAPAIAAPPRCTASDPAKAPESRPIGVRAPATITEDPMSRRYLRPAGCDGHRSPRDTVTDMTLPADPAIVGIDHVGLAVPDLDAAITFHTEVLGGSVAHREVNEEQGVEEVMISLRFRRPDPTPRATAGIVHDRQIHRPQRSWPAATCLPGDRYRCRLGQPAGSRGAAAL